jgi:hypothetical protein
MILPFFFTGCIPMPALQGGKVTHNLGGVSSSMNQSENPKEPSSQKTESSFKMSFVAPAGSQVNLSGTPGFRPPEASSSNSLAYAGKGATKGATVTSLPSLVVAGGGIVLSKDTPITVESSSKAESNIGGSWYDKGREVLAKMKGMQPVLIAGMIGGIALIAGGGAMLYFGWAKAGIVGIVCGFGVITFTIVMPMHGVLVLSIGGALFVLVGGALALGWYKGKDANSNGVPDAVETLIDEVEGKAKAPSP